MHYRGAGDMSDVGVGEARGGGRPGAVQAEPRQGVLLIGHISFFGAFPVISVVLI